MPRQLTLEDRLVRARTMLLSQHPYWGSLALRLHLVEDPAAETMCTDGSRIRYAPEWTSKLTDAEMRGVLAHEVGHCIYKHMYRRGARDMQRWNVAGDYAVNLILKDAGIALPESALLDEAYRDPKTGYPLAAEVIYHRLPTAPEDLPDPSGTGTFEDPPEPSETEPTDEPDAPQEMTESDWDIESIAAEAATDAHGALGRGEKRAIDAAREPKQSLEEEVREFLTNLNPDGYTWVPPNRRYAWQGIILPGIRKESYPPFAICIDTSGSLTQPDLDHFGAILDRFRSEVRPEYVKVVYCDAEVQGTQTFYPDEPMILEAAGGGGTDFQPALDLVGQSIEDGEPLAACLYLTDLYANTPEEPDYPVLWVISPASSEKAGPFGKSVRLDPYEV